MGDAALRRSLSVVAAHARERNVWASARDRDALLMGASHGVEPRARAIAVDGLLSLATYEANKVPLWGHARGRSALYGTAFGGLAPPLREAARRRLAALLAGDDVLARLGALTGPCVEETASGDALRDALDLVAMGGLVGRDARCRGGAVDALCALARGPAALRRRCWLHAGVRAVLVLAVDAPAGGTRSAALGAIQRPVAGAIFERFRVGKQ